MPPVSEAQASPRARAPIPTPAVKAPNAPSQPPAAKATGPAEEPKGSEGSAKRPSIPPPQVPSPAEMYLQKALAELENLKRTITPMLKSDLSSGDSSRIGLAWQGMRDAIIGLNASSVTQSTLLGELRRGGAPVPREADKEPKEKGKQSAPRPAQTARPTLQEVVAEAVTEPLREAVKVAAVSALQNPVRVASNPASGPPAVKALRPPTAKQIVNSRPKTRSAPQKSKYTVVVCSNKGKTTHDALLAEVSSLLQDKGARIHRTGFAPGPGVLFIDADSEKSRSIIEETVRNSTEIRLRDTETKHAPKIVVHGIPKATMTF
ncbi:hypothetical protein R5R35_004623 [Gryllus longicercus]|uniref:Uncharacterized protein n=1 Tax=Gryllus longicercus TaxID=2509291 RepID=A0AAN9ZJB1_9ORTH